MVKARVGKNCLFEFQQRGYAQFKCLGNLLKRVNLCSRRVFALQQLNVFVVDSGSFSELFLGQFVFFAQLSQTFCKFYADIRIHTVLIIAILERA